MGLLRRFWTPKTLKDPAQLDKLSLRHLEKAGADLALPRHVIHFVYFDEEGDARRAGDEIPRAGWETTVVPPDDPASKWIVRAEATRVLDSHSVRSYRAWFEQIAESYNGEYDGWEAANNP